MVVFLLAAGVTVAVLAARDGGGSDGTTPPSVVTTQLPLRLTRAWSAPTGGNVFASSGAGRDTVVVGSEDKSVYGFDAANGRDAGASRPAARCRRRPRLRRQPRTWAVSTATSTRTRRRPTAAMRWKHDLHYEIVSSAVVTDGLVIVGANGLDGLDAATGTERWHARHR